MLFNVKTLKYFKMKRSRLYIFLNSLNKRKGGGDWKDIVKIFKRFKKNIKMERIKSKDDFIIRKEKYTNSWFLECKDLIIIYIIKNNKNGFEERINGSNYNFMIYETSFHYIYFCTSHSTDKIDDFLKNLVLDYSDKRILLISNYGRNFSSFIFLNKYIYEESDGLLNTKEIFFVEKGDLHRSGALSLQGDSSLILKVQIIIKYIIACKHLSPHYFPIN